MHQPQPQQIRLDTKDLKRKVCPLCGYDGFEVEHTIYEIPLFYRAHFNNQEVVGIPLWRCMECGKRSTNEELETAESLNELNKPAVKLV